MSDTHETSADIIAEMRDEAAKADMEQDYSIDDAAEMMREFAWRLEAAHKRDTKELRVEIERLKEERNYSGVRERERLRANGFAIVPKEQLERGDAAKLREALRECAQYIACVGGIGVGEVTINDNVHLIPEELTQKAIAALSAPPRNCDVYATVEEARKVWCGTPSRDWDYLCDWLYAPATEKEGGGR